MKAIIHRGSHEIGGTCVELVAGRSRILVDFGLPIQKDSLARSGQRLFSGQASEKLRRSRILPDIKGLYKNEERSVDAILLSHSHPDHYGLLSYVHPDMPIYLSSGAKELIDISAIFTPCKTDVLNTRIIKGSKTPFRVSDFIITPYLVDHSAFDALAFLVESGGKRLFYSGDFRGHGRKCGLFKNIVKNPPADVDCLMMEGTAVGRDSAICKDEDDVKKKIWEILNVASKTTFIFASSQNIDRLVSVYKACRSAGIVFVIDIYTAYILERLGRLSKALPQFSWRNIRVRFDPRQAMAAAEKISPSILYRYNTRKIKDEEIRKLGSKALVLGRDNMCFWNMVKNMGDISGSRIIYSMWNGYMTPGFKMRCKSTGIVIENLHSSGHATTGDLQIFADAINPKKLVPVHTLSPEKYRKLFKNVRIYNDGEVFDI